MLKLLKFEWKNRWRAAAIALVGYEVLSLLLLLWIESKDLMATSNGAIIVLHFMLAAAFMLLVVVDGVNALRLELKQNSRDLYFAFPQSGYQKLGAKLLSSGILTAIGGSIALLTTMGAVQVHTGASVLAEAWKLLGANLSDVSFVLTAGMLQLLFFYGMIYLSFTIYRAFFSQFKLGGIITVAIYVLLNYIYYTLFGWIDGAVPSIGSAGMGLWLQQWPMLIALTAVAVSTYAAGGFLMQNRLNLD